jgi:hypothetical protein
MRVLKSSVSFSPITHPKVRTWQLLPTLSIKTHTATTSYSKVSRGLRFPLEISGLCTRRNVRRLPTRDSDNLVSPFMQAVNQTARHFATLREL